MKHSVQKFVAFILIISFFLIITPHPARADVWGANWEAALLKEMLEEAYLKIKESVIAALKMNAIRMIQSQLMSVMGGGGAGGAQIVTNWRQTIYGSADREARLVVNDYFSSTKSGAGGMGGQKIVSAGEKMYNTDPTSVRPTIDRYVQGGDVSKIFDKNYTPNPAQALNDLSKMRNYPAFYALTAEGLYAVNYGEKAGSEAAKNIAYGGVKGTGDTGGKTGGKLGGQEKITMPGSVKRDVFSQIMNMPTNMVALSRSIPEIVAGMVTQMLSQMINRGFSMMNSQINSQMSGFRGQFGGSVPQIQNLIQRGYR